MMTNDATVTHGMASSIRAATESEVFDLGGLGPDTIENIIVDALSQPFSSREEMIRITLVVGAGKQSRQKYHAQAMKVVTSTLQNKCGFVEDRGASCVMECQGMFKVQHDTGKNLKTVVLFPKMISSTGAKGGKNNPSDTAGEKSRYDDMMFPVNSMEYKAAASSLTVFQNMVKAKCTSWSQKKALLELMEHQFVEQIIQPVEDLLTRGQQVPSDLQHYYDSVLVEISEKQHFVKQAMHQQVETGDLTEYEINHLLEQVDHRIQTLSKGGSPQPALTKAKERRDMLKSFNPTPLPKLQHHAALGKLWKQVYAIPIPLDLDGNSGRLLTAQESKLVAKRDNLMQEIDQLEYASQGWLEDDEIFEWRVQECRSEFEERFAPSSKRSGKTRPGTSYSSSVSSNFGSTGSSSRTPVTKWITPMDKKGPTAAKKKSKMKKGDLFSAMMAASSSDEEDSDGNGNTQDQGSWQQVGKKQGGSKITASKPQSKAKQINQSQRSDESEEASQEEESTQQEQTGSAAAGKKKRNKKKKKGKASNDDFDIDGTTDKSTLEQESSVSQSIPMAILNILLAILLWLVSLVFGSKKKGKKKKKS